MLIQNIGENEGAKRSLGSWISITDYIQEKHRLACGTSHSPGCPTLDVGGWGFPCPSLDRETDFRRKTHWSGAMRGGMWKAWSAPTKPGPTTASKAGAGNGCSQGWCLFLCLRDGGREVQGIPRCPSEVVWMHRKATHLAHLCTSGFCGKSWQDCSLTGIVCIHTFSSGASWEAYR